MLIEIDSWTDVKNQRPETITSIKKSIVRCSSEEFQHLIDFVSQLKRRKQILQEINREAKICELIPAQLTSRIGK